MTATPTTATWIDRDALAARTGHPVHYRWRMPGDPEVHPKADVVVVAPATFNLLNKWALGISDNVALGVLHELLGLGMPGTTAAPTDGRPSPSCCQRRPADATRLQGREATQDPVGAAVTSYRALFPIAAEAVAWAADIMRSRPPGTLTSKGDRDIASDLDYEIERGLRARLGTATPDIGFLGEEEGSTGSAEVQWVLDPIDGTANFVRGIPLCAVSLGLLHGTEAVLGAIELPFLGSRYTAAKGEGAYVDGKPIRVRDTRLLSQAVVAIGDYAVGHGAAAKNHLRLALTAHLAETVQRVRMTGSAALDLVWLAEGKLDAAITLSNNPWDMTAGVAIAREAGAAVRDHDGAEHRSDSAMTIAVAPALVETVLSLIDGSLAA
ncbi:inositol monophosphatase family protein [Micromonospora echinospora]|uniref:inositol monophosphatase family protein n=1 Tax=Micromonospora echinospora TaxID=1877 RepID=UPI0034119155